LVSRPNRPQAAGLSLTGGPGQSLQDRSKVEPAIEDVLHLAEVSMPLLLEAEGTVRTRQGRLEVAQHRVDGQKLRILGAGSAAARDMRFVPDARALKQPRPSDTSVAGAARERSANASSAALVNGLGNRHTNIGWPDSVVCTVAT